MTKNFKSPSDFQPLNDRVLVRPIEVEEVSACGIIIPDTAKEKPVAGEVIAIGRGAVNNNGEIIPLLIKVGDMIMFQKWAGTEITIAKEKLLIVKESDILGRCIREGCNKHECSK